MRTETVEELFARIMEAKKWEKQELAEYIGVHPSTLSQKLGAHWNAHWQVFLRLLPLLIKLKFLTHEDIYGTSDNGRKGRTDKTEDSQDLPETRKKRYIMLTKMENATVLQ